MINHYDQRIDAMKAAEFEFNERRLYAYYLAADTVAECVTWVWFDRTDEEGERNIDRLAAYKRKRAILENVPCETAALIWP